MESCSIPSCHNPTEHRASGPRSASWHTRLVVLMNQDGGTESEGKRRNESLANSFPSPLPNKNAARQPSTATKARESPETLRHTVLGKKRRVSAEMTG